MTYVAPPVARTLGQAQTFVYNDAHISHWHQILSLGVRVASKMCQGRMEAPGRASDMDLISPRTRCHLSIIIWFLVRGLIEKIYWKRAFLWGDSDNVILTLSTTHSKRI